MNEELDPRVTSFARAVVRVLLIIAAAKGLSISPVWIGGIQGSLEIAFLSVAAYQVWMTTKKIDGWHLARAIARPLPTILVLANVKADATDLLQLIATTEMAVQLAFSIAESRRPKPE